MNNVIGIAVALLVIIGGGWYFLSGSENQAANQTTEVSQQGSADAQAEKLEMERMEKNEESAMEKQEGDSMEKMEKEDVMMKKEEDKMEKSSDEGVMIKTETEAEVMIKEEPVSAGPGVFKAYSANAVASADGDIVIGFFADWCPSCRALKSDIGANASAIPSDLLILDANYDSETELKKRYGVTTQHTLVQVDKNGTLVKKWRGGNTLSSVVSQLN